MDMLCSFFTVLLKYDSRQTRCIGKICWAELCALLNTHVAVGAQHVALVGARGGAHAHSHTHLDLSFTICRARVPTSEHASERPLVGCCRSSSSKEHVELFTSLEPTAHEASARSTSGVSRNWTMTLTEPGTLGSVMTSVAPESKISEMARSRCFL